MVNFSDHRAANPQLSSVAQNSESSQSNLVQQLNEALEKFAEAAAAIEARFARHPKDLADRRKAITQLRKAGGRMKEIPVLKGAASKLQPIPTVVAIETPAPSSLNPANWLPVVNTWLKGATE